MKRKHVHRILCIIMGGIFLISGAASHLTGSISVSAETLDPERETVKEEPEEKSTEEVLEETPISEEGISEPGSPSEEDKTTEVSAWGGANTGRSCCE